MGNEYNESLVAAIQGELALAGVVVLHGLLLVLSSVLALVSSSVLNQLLRMDSH